MLLILRTNIYFSYHVRNFLNVSYNKEVFEYNMAIIDKNNKI